VLSSAVDDPVPFLGFRLQRTLGSRPVDSPEHKARLAEEAMAVVNEHPNATVRKLYAGEVATRVGLPVADLVRIAEAGTRRPAVRVRTKRTLGSMENAEFAALVLLVQEWDEIAPWLVEALFDDDANRMAFLALAEVEGDLNAALEVAPPDSREVLERAAVADLRIDALIEAKTLIAAAVRRELRPRTALVDRAAIDEDRQARLDVQALNEADDELALMAAESLLGWLNRRTEDHTGGDD
jgi:DNA primase